MPKLFAFRNAVQLAVTLFMVAASSLAMAEPLRVCSDPDNLPFSKAEGSARGLYVELADLIGKRLGVTIEYVWYLTYNQRRALRNTMDGCDAYFALPLDPNYKIDGADKTVAFLDVRYAVVSRPEWAITKIDDLRGKTLGVTYNSTPQIYFSNLEGFRVKSYRDSQEVIAAIEAGDIDAGVLWGPHIGFLNNTTYHGYWRLTPLAGKGLGGPVAIAVRRGNAALKDQINEALEALRPEIIELAKKFGFPTGVPLVVEPSGIGQLPPNGAITSGGAAADHPSGGGSVDAGEDDTKDLRRYLRRVNDATSDRGDERVSAEADMEDTRAMFNSRCAHCHSRNGASPQPERDLRRLRSRYADDWRNVARTTIINGRSGYGMPNWGETLSQQEIDNVLAFLETIQRKP